MRKPIIAANWKMNIGPKEAEDFLSTFASQLDNLTDAADVVIAPPYVTIPAAVSALHSNSAVSIASQNVSEQDNGAFTGEISTMMLKELFVRYVIAIYTYGAAVLPLIIGWQHCSNGRWLPQKQFLVILVKVLGLKKIDNQA